MYPEMTRILADPSASDWLKSAIRALLNRDCVDAANDAELLARLFADRLDAVFDAAFGRPVKEAGHVR